MKTLTLLQPWAWLVIHGPKRWENRTWTTTYRGPLLIHAGRSRARMADAYADPRLAAILPEPSTLFFSAVIGVVDLSGIEPIDRVLGEPFAEGPWCWRLANPRPLSPPVPMKGRRRLWETMGDFIL
ncbi:MAG: ASCH domain-containing protein [Phycisphaerae bacterium]|nr:ASCH domain-containing protein [Phycisphaerae bacterium]